MSAAAAFAYITCGNFAYNNDDEEAAATVHGTSTTTDATTTATAQRSKTNNKETLQRGVTVTQHDKAPKSSSSSRASEHGRVTKQHEETHDEKKSSDCAVATTSHARANIKNEPKRMRHEDQALPTMPLYEASAASQTENCWSEPSYQAFLVRGPTYFETKTKVVSNKYLMRARGCDLFLHAEEQSQAPGLSLREKNHKILEGRLRHEPTLLVNFQFPWGYLLLYYQVPAQLEKYMGNGTILIPMDSALSPPEQTLAAWLQGDASYKNERFKLIPAITDGPWVVRQIVTGTPVIIGKKLPVSYDFDKGNNEQQKPLIVATLDIGSSSAAAKRIVGVCRRYMSSLTVDIGFVVQAETLGELPEQMLGCIRIHGPDPLRAVPLK